MIGQITRSALPPATWLLLCASTLSAQQAGTDSATDVQGYVPPTETEASQPAAPEAAKTSAAASSSSATGIILPGRSEADVEQGMRAADQALNRADAELTRLQQRGKKADATLRSQESRLAELEALKGKADKEKRKADKAELETQKKAVERQKALTEQLKALNDAEIEAARKAVELVIAQQRALELEHLLIGKRAERSQLVPDLEKETLVAQKRAAQLERDLAGKKEFVAGKRLDVYRASHETDKP